MFTTEEFVNDCRATLLEHSLASAMKELMQRTVADAAAIEAALGTPSWAGLTTLHRSPELTMLHVI